MKTLSAPPPPSGSPFFSVFEQDPDRPAEILQVLILSDLQAVPQRIAQLSQWLSAHDYSFKIHLILVIGVSRPAPHCTTTHEALAEQANDSAAIAQLENICPRVIYVPGLHEHPTAWETKENAIPRLTPFSHNAVAGPLHVAPDLYVVHRRFADGISDNPVHHLPVSWCHTIHAKFTRPPRFRISSMPSAIVLCSSQLPDAHTSKSKSRGLLRTVRSLLSLSRNTAPNLHFILAIAPPKMQRVPNSSTVFRNAERTLDPGSFQDGYFCIASFARPDVWDPIKEPDIDDEQLEFESAWEVQNITKYNLDNKLTEDDEDDPEDRTSGDGDDGELQNGDNENDDGSVDDDGRDGRGSFNMHADNRRDDEESNNGDVYDSECDKASIQSETTRVPISFQN